jgi:beta-galactosidase beta subunit
LSGVFVHFRAPLQKAITRNLDEDYTFYTGETSLVRVGKGCLLFFPDDLHMPCVQAGESSKVKKVVVQV